MTLDLDRPAAPVAATGQPTTGQRAAATAAVVPLSPVLVAEWSALADRAIEPNPFYRPEFLLPVLDYLRPRDPRAIAVRCRGTLTGLVPVVSERLGLGFTGRHDTVVYHQYGPLGTPLVDRDHLEATLAALFDRAAPGLPSSLVMHLADGPLCQALFRHAAARGLRPAVLGRSSRAALDATQTPAAFHTGALDRKKRKDLSRLMRRLAEQGKVRHRVHADPSAAAGALERFLDLERSGWKGRRGTALASQQERSRTAGAVIAGLAAAGHVRIDEIDVDGAPVASLVSLTDGPRLYTWKIAYSEAAARFSPGSQIVLALTGSLLEDPQFEFADSLATPDHPMINHLWRQRLTLTRAMIPLRRPSPLAAAAVAADAAAHAAARRAAKHALAAARACMKR